MPDNRNFDISAVENGFEIRISQPSSGEIYESPFRAVAISKSDVRALFDKWLEGEDKPKIESE